MSVASLWYLIFIPALSEAAVTSLTSTPSSPSFAIETHDLILMWNYTLDGSVFLARFSNVTGGGSDEIARKVQGGSISVKNNYQVRFSANISDTHAWLKIRRVQRSDKGRYQFAVTASGSGSIMNVVEVIVQSVTSLTSNPSSPLFAIETHDLTLIWNYTLDDSVLLAIFSNVTGGGSDVIAGKGQGGSISVDYKYNDRFSAGISETHAWLRIRRVQRSDQGKYQFYLSATGSGTVTNVVEVIVQYAPTVTTQQCSTSVTESDNVTLSCSATGFPLPSVTWIRASTREVLSNNTMHIITAVKRNESGSYECLAWNGIENNGTKTCTIDVQYHPKIMLLTEYKVAVHQSLTLHCRAEGNPQPTFTWTPCDPQENVCDKSTLIISEVSNGGVYTCKVTNKLGSDSANTNVVIAGTEINVTLVITSESCIAEKWYQFLMLSKELNEVISLIFVNESAYRRTTVMDVRCESLIVDLTLKFSSTVTEKWVLTMLKEATKGGKLGKFSVNTSSIIGTRTFIQSTISPSISKTTPSSSDVEVCGGCSCNCNVLIALVSIFAAINILLIVYIIWLHKKGTSERGRSYAESTSKRGNGNATVMNTAVEMEVHQPDRQQTSEVSFRNPYMALDDARRSNDLPEVTLTTDTSQTSQYAPLHPSTLSGEIPRENVTIEKIIGKGAFGQVAKGTVIGLRGRPQMTLVAVKMLKATAPESYRKDLLSELEVMKTLKPHPHVIKLLGCVTESEPLLVLIEYVPYGDLLGYLRKSRGLNDTYYKDPDIKPQTSLTSQQLMKFAWQIADGMSYLSSRSIIHRDLAARNVLVGENETCKVTDFGMARDVQQESIYERKTKGRLPVKWTAYEALMYGTYTTKSDVWSYGIMLYEIFTIGGSPYPRMDGRKIASLLQQGYRMPKPQHVNDDLYKIMTICWEEDPNVRPAFAELRNKLKRMENQHKRLINMEMYDTQLYANVEDLVV